MFKCPFYCSLIMLLDCLSQQLHFLYSFATSELTFFNFMANAVVAVHCLHSEPRNGGANGANMLTMMHTASEKTEPNSLLVLCVLWRCMQYYKPTSSTKQLDQFTFTTASSIIFRSLYTFAVRIFCIKEATEPHVFSLKRKINPYTSEELELLRGNSNTNRRCTCAFVNEKKKKMVAKSG